MYLVFDLPKPGDDFPSAHTVAFCIHRELVKWEERYQIEYKTKYHKNTLRLIFKTESEYHFFMLTWKPDPVISGYRLSENWLRVRIINPPKH